MSENRLDIREKKKRQRCDRLDRVFPYRSAGGKETVGQVGGSPLLTGIFGAPRRSICFSQRLTSGELTSGT